MMIVITPACVPVESLAESRRDAATIESDGPISVRPTGTEFSGCAIESDSESLPVTVTGCDTA
jgi:hypothetical protein